MRTARCTIGSVTLDLIDAMELSEVLDYLHDWLRGANAAVHDDLHRFAGDQQATQLIQRRLMAFSHLLVFGEADIDDEPDDEPDDVAEQDPSRELSW
ncbi:MAG: hypothetical protein KY440_13650 [Actinobacteria bacterium]|nr:hypothetical protein [Actinomycetota bacterium]